MGLVGGEENGNGERVGEVHIGSKNKYKRMDSDFIEEDLALYSDGMVMTRKNSNSKKFVFLCAIFASLNSVLLGYDVGVMSGAILFIQEDLKISEVQEEVLVGILSIISLLGSLAAGKTSDAIGRKWTIAFAAIIFQTGAAVMTFAPNFRVLMIGLPAHLSWRIMLGVGIFPSIFMGFALFVIPESPRWLVMQNRIEEAREVLLKTNESEREVEERLAEIQVAAGMANAEKYEAKAVWHEILYPSPSVRRMLITGCGIQCFQQITGIDATVYYSPTIFKDAGIRGNTQLLAATVAVGFTKTMFILVATFLIDKVGRKPLLYVSTIGMTTCLIGLSLTLTFMGKGKIGIGLAILAVCGNVAFFSVGIGPICWVMSSEIFPLRLRAQASALGAVGSRVSSGAVAMSFLSVSRAITTRAGNGRYTAVGAKRMRGWHACLTTKERGIDNLQFLISLALNYQHGHCWRHFYF
nr:putative polyol transporter 4 [Quercus suber]